MGRLSASARTRWGFDRCHRVAVLRTSGTRYEKPFFALNDTTFNARHTIAPELEPPAIVTPLPETARNADRADEQHDAGVGGVVAKTLREYQHQHRE